MSPYSDALKQTIKLAAIVAAVMVAFVIDDRDTPREAAIRFIWLVAAGAAFRFGQAFFDIRRQNRARDMNTRA